MTTYVALLRGINVSGQNKIAMDRLRALFEDLGHTDVTTYIQSGNVVFASPSDRPLDLARGVEERIARELGLAVGVVTRSRDELARIVERNPFLPRGADPARLHVTFLGGASDPAKVAAIPPDEFAPDAFQVADREVYLHCPGGYGQTKLNNAFWERRLRVPATTRNWNTVTTLLRLAGG